ncbi:MAG TPA: response regulator transcription factor [Gammaproteobacteria bacterium]|nr:response regulator transcription factor [Gammaproteobacteria bacterium]
MLRIVVVDDHLMLIQGIKKLLEGRSGLQVVGEAYDGREGVELVKRLKPDIAIVDITMPGLNGLDATRAIAKLSPRTKTILLTMHKENPYVTEALDAGVHAYVIKSQTAGDLLRAIDEVAANRVYLSPSIASVVVNAYRHKDGVDTVPLTLREREVLQLIAEGQKTKQIAARLGISVKTAESHRTRIMKKLDVHDTANLVRYAIRRGLISA